MVLRTRREGRFFLRLAAVAFRACRLEENSRFATWLGMGMTAMATFGELHHGDAPLLLPNAWDAGSVLAFAAAGFPAIGTTSFGIAASSGVPDGDRSSKAATLALYAQVGSLQVHLSADIEDGFSDAPEEVADYVAELAALGVVGINLEDSRSGQLVDPALVVAKIAAIKQRTPGIFINARIDNFWFAEQATVEAVRQRAHLYAEAGADGIFVPGAFDEKRLFRTWLPGSSYRSMC